MAEELKPPFVRHTPRHIWGDWWRVLERVPVDFWPGMFIEQGEAISETEAIRLWNQRQPAAERTER